MLTYLTMPHVVSIFLPYGLAINLLPGKYPPSGLGQVACHRDHRLLVILGPLDALIQPYHMGSCQPPLVDHDQVARPYKRPFQIAVHVAAHLPHTSVTTAGMHTRHQPGIAGQMRSAGKPIYSADL